MARNSLPSPLESALANAPTFGLPDSFKQAPQQSATFTPGDVPFQSYFNAASSKYGVPVNVLMALAQQESSFNPTAVGQPTKYGRAKGLMQYIPSTAQAMGINPYDPVQSIDAAAKQLKTRLDKGYSMQEAISAHFGGDDRQQWGPKTRAYGVEVLGKAQRFFDGTQGSISQPQQIGGLPTEQGAVSQDPSVGSPDLAALQERGTKIDTLLSQLNQDEPDRYRALTQEEIAQYQQQQKNPTQQQSVPQLTADTPEMPALDYSAAQATQAEAKGIADKALDAVKDAGTLLTSGVNTAAKDVQELVGKIPYIGKPIVDAADRFDRWANGKSSEEIFKEWDRDTEKSLSPEMLQARKKAWVIEPGDDQGDGTKATSYSFGPAWSDPRAYASGILESLPEMAITMGGSGRLASMAYKRALAKGATREAAAKTAAKTAMFAGGFLEGGLGGAQSSRETREQILKLPPEQLKDSEALASLMDSGRSFEDARRELADNAASKAFVLAGVTTGMFGGMGDRALAKIITGNSGRLKAALTGALGEGLFEEVPQSATQQMSQNYAMQDADPNTPLMRGVANQAAGGLAVGGLMGAGMGAAAPRSGQGTQPAADAAPPQEVAQVDPQQAAMEEAVAAVPTPSRDDTGLSDDAGPLERAARGTAQQPTSENGNFWAGEPGATIQMQAKGDPQTAMVATVERYERDGGVTVRGEDGTPYTVSSDEVDITAAADPQVTTDQQMQDAGTSEEVKAERAQFEEQQGKERQAAIEQALQEQGVDPNTGEILDSSPAAKEEAAPVQKALDEMDEGELRDRMRYLARQAKTNGGWDKRLSDERRKVEHVLDAKVQAAKAPTVEEQPDAQQSDAVIGADGKPKWFSTAEKAAAHIEKKGLTGYAPQEVQPGRFELRATTAEAPKPAAPRKEASNPRMNRVKKLVGEVGQTVSPSGEVGGLQPGARYTVDRIEKNGTTHLTNQETGDTTTVSMPDLEVGKSRRVEWSKVDAQAVAETATAEQSAQQTADAGDLLPDAGNMVAEQQGNWREQAAAALELVPDDHPMKRKWAANVKNGLKSESDRAGVMQAIVAAQAEPVSNPDVNQSADLPAQEGVSGETVTAPVQAEATQQAEYGANNKLVSQDRAAELRERLKAKFAQLNSGIDPEILAIGTELAVFHIEASARKFSEFAKAMAADLDMPLARLRPYLRSWYNGARDMMEDSNVSIEGMDSPDTVRAELAKLDEQPTEQPPAVVSTPEQTPNELGPRPTSGLDAMVAEFDAEVERNGTATELGEPGAPALARAPAEPVRAAAEERAAGDEAAAGGSDDGQGNERPGAAGNDRARGLGDDEGELPVSAGRAARGGRNAAERGGPASRDGDADGRAVLPAAGVTSQNRAADLFTINPDEIGRGGDKTKFANNVAAIRVLKDLEATGREVTAADQDALAKYVGWGGIPSAFERTDSTANKGWEKQVAELKALLTPEEYAAAAASTRNAHYTSPEIVSGMWKALRQLGFTGGRVIEPSAGVGNFFGLMPQDARGSSALHGVELDRITSGIATALYPDAKIARMGYQEYAIPDGYFDVAVGNPPFGSEKLYDANRKDLSGFSIHNYFFARSVDALRPGGVLAMVVTNRFLDGNSDKARRYIAERADLVGAIRLPNNAFAKNAGTEVTTDIIILQRRAPGQKPSGSSWMNVVDYTDKNGATVPLNEYFQSNPDNMLGEFGAFGTMYRAGDSALVARDGQNTQALLDAAINRLPSGIMESAVPVKPETRETVQAENTRVGSMFISGDGRVMLRGEDVMGERTGEVVEFRSVKAEERVKGMLRLRDNLSRLRQLQLSNTASEAAIEEARARLNKTYDSFVKSNGPINSQANKLLFRDDPTWPQISALEDSYDRGVSAAVARTTGEEPRPQSAEKAAIFTKRTQQPYSAPTSASSAKDALVTTLAERGRVDMDMMVQLYGKPEEQIAEELGELLFSDPDAGWQTRDQYLSGNVKTKLARAEAAAKISPDYARNVEALRAVQPKDIEAVDINVKPGATWIPADVMGSFADHITEKTGNKAFYNPLNANWSFPKLEATSSATARFGTSRMSVGQIIEAAAAQKAVQVYDEGRDGTRTLNETETQLANDKVKSVKEEWDRWIWSDDARRARLSRFYNDLFNTDVRREFDGAHLKFPGKISDDIIKLRPHQGNAVWRIVQGGSTLADHVVGAGKTFTLVAAAMELRRLGLARKPMFVVPNHLVGQWAQDFIKLYPGANVLAATKRDFEKANRKRFFARIATGDLDAVIVAHSSFGKVGMKPETEAEFIQEEIADLTASIDAIEAAEGKKSRNVKQAAERRTKMQEKLKALLDTGNKDDSLYWDDLGIDALFLDEAHEFKNLAYSTGMRNVAGLGSSAGSQKATDLYMKTRVVRKATGGRNVVFATGTPISNTMAEMYTMQRYLDYDNLKQSGLSHFDAWARMFGEVVTDWELSPSGQYKLNSRFSKFVNMPELMQRYTSFADVINRDDINRMLAAQGKRLPVPKVKGGKPENVVVERSQWQAQYIGEPIKDADGNDTDQFPEGSLVYRAENLPKKAEKGGDNMLKIMSDARKAALDMRLIDPDYPDNPDSKVNFSANNIKEDYDRWHADRGTQLVFIDLSTPKGARADEAAHLRDLIQRSESSDPAVAEPAQAELDKISPDEIDALNSAFSVYDDLKQKLVERGIPADEIAFIHDAKTDLQKTDLFAKVRSGRVRVLFGSTAKMGAGMNVQERLVALHHLDAPWRPSDLEQREGRIIRQGNKLYDRDPEGFEVGIYRYATKQTLDSRMWQTIEGKATFIEQVRKGDTGAREIEDVAGEAANAAEMKAASSGNPLILEEMALRQRIRTLENERTAHDRDQFRIRDRIGMEQGNVKTINRQLVELRADDKLAQPAKFEVAIDGQTFDKRKDAGEAILQQAMQMEQTGEETRQIGTYGGFQLTLEKLYAETYALEVSGTGTYSTKVAMGDDPAGLAMRMTNSVRDLPAAIEKMEEALAQSKAAIPALQAQVKPWPKEEQLKEATARHAEVIEQLRPKKKTDEQAVVKPATDVAEPQLNDLAMDTPYSRLPEGNRIQLAARLRKLEQQKEQLTPEQYSEQLGELASWLEERSRENAFQRAVAERQRGADMVLERLHRARRRGEIGEEAADIAIWALNRNPQLAEDLGFSISSKGGSRYDRAERVARLMTEAMRDTAPIHEILHHTERMMPPGVQKGIAQEYNKAWARAYKKATPEQREALDALRLSAFGNSAARDATMKAFQSGLLDYDQHYQLTNASEYWAVNAASIMSARHGASKQGWVARAREWMRGFIQKLRAVFGLPSAAAVIRGLDAVTKGDGSFLTTSMLATNPAADTPLRDLSGDYADMPTSPSGMDPAPEIPTDEQDRSRLRQWWDKAKNAPSDLTTDAMQKGLALIPFRPLVQEMARNMPAASEYLRLKQSMDAMRNRWHAKTDEVAQDWLKYRKDNTEENVELMNLMHESTIAQVDPSEEYPSEISNRDREALRFAAPGSDREKELLKRIVEDKKQREEWDKLNARYKALSPQARQVFQEVRDAYNSLADEYEKVLLANMEKAINVRIKKAEREHRYEMQRIEDEGLTGEERTEAMDDADKKLRVAKTKTAWNRKARMTQLRQQFEMNRLTGPYFPLARFGNLFVTVRDAKTGKVESFSKFEKAAEQREFADLMRRNKDYKVQVGTLDDTGSLRKAVDPNFVADVEDILADLPNAESVKDEVWQRYLESLPDFSVRKNRIHRTGRAGFNADALRAFGNQMFHGSHQLARLAHSFDMEEALDASREEAVTSKDPVRDGLVVNEMEKRHEFIMNPTGGPLVQKITQAAFIYALAASPKAALVNLSQTVIMGIPILAGYDGSAKGVTRAAEQLTRAMGDFTRGKGKTENSKRLTADERKAMAEAYEIGIIDRTQSHDLAGIGETGVEYSPARTKIMAMLAWGFHHTERLNREVTFLAAYRMARAKGLPHIGAVQKAGDLTWKTHFDYQNTSRPRIMHSDTMKALLVFRNFSINMLYRLFRDIHQATQGDTPEVRKEAKVQLAGITGMMMLSAGITGTWGFGIMMMIASAFMDDEKDPEVELKKNMVEALGPMMAGIVLDGVPGYATGTSLSDSIGMRDLWFRSPSSQLEGKDEADYWKAQLLGAAPSIADNIVRGYGLLKEGQIYRGIETMMPKAIKDPMKAIRYGTEGATNKRGDTIVEDIDSLDIIRQALGFVPAKIAEQYDINNAGYNLQQTIIRKRQALMDAWWKAEEAGQEAKLDSLEKDIEAYNDKYPEQEITPKTLRRSARTREDNAENATGGMRYNRKLRDRILEEQPPTIYR